MRRGKERRPGGGRTPKLELREQMLVALNYMRTYTVQEAIAASFGIKQYDVSRIITRLSGPLIRCLPHPEKGLRHGQAGRHHGGGGAANTGTAGRIYYAQCLHGFLEAPARRLPAGERIIGSLPTNRACWGSGPHHACRTWRNQNCK